MLVAQVAEDNNKIAGNVWVMTFRWSHSSRVMDNHKPEFEVGELSKLTKWLNGG
jgi:hypothetical protein